MQINNSFDIVALIKDVELEEIESTNQTFIVHTLCRKGTNKKTILLKKGLPSKLKTFVCTHEIGITHNEMQYIFTRCLDAYKGNYETVFDVDVKIAI